MNARFQRRRFLRGLGVCLGLPMLESTVPLGAWGKVTAAGGKPAAPLRTVFLYIPNGVNVDAWRPKGEGTDFELNRTMEPLAEFRRDLQVITGLAHQNGFAGPDGAGDHARAVGTILTGMRPKKTAGADIRLGISVDQLAAQHTGDAVRFASLELACEGVRKSGLCDSGYSCAYQFNLSWRSETQPVAAESNPRAVFERLFGDGDADERRAGYQARRKQRRSILDFIGDDARALARGASAEDRRKLDEYLTGVREIERRVERNERFGEPPNPDVAAPTDDPAGYREHIRLMYDMIVAAFQTDSTRIATFMPAHDGSNRTFEEIGVRDGHHTLSHHQGDAEKLEKIARIDRFYAEQFAYFLGRLRDAKDPTGRTLLDDSLIVYAGGLSDGNRHRHDDLPVILAGRGGGRLNAGRHLRVPERTPMTNLYLTMLDVLGVPAERFGDSSGRLDEVLR